MQCNEIVVCSLVSVTFFSIGNEMSIWCCCYLLDGRFLFVFRMPNIHSIISTVRHWRNRCQKKMASIFALNFSKHRDIERQEKNIFDEHSNVFCFRFRWFAFVCISAVAPFFSVNVQKASEREKKRSNINFIETVCSFHSQLSPNSAFANFLKLQSIHVTQRTLGLLHLIDCYFYRLITAT